MFDRINLDAALQEHRNQMDAAERAAQFLPERNSRIRRLLAARRPRPERATGDRQRGTVIVPQPATEGERRLLSGAILPPIGWPGA